MKIRQKIYLPLKAFLDIFFALFLLVLLFVPIILIGICVKCSSKGPIFFKQRRIGKNNKEFNLLKFRTMRIDSPSDVPTHLLDNPEIYITKLGKFLRKTSIDELPQLFNILCLKMSFVGPRPALYNQFDLIELRNKNNSSKIRPGLTGLAQVKGRDTPSIQTKATYDGQYYKKFGFFYDFGIVLLTFGRVFREDGVREGKEKDE